MVLTFSEETMFVILFWIHNNRGEVCLVISVLILQISQPKFTESSNSPKVIELVCGRVREPGLELKFLATSLQNHDVSL